MILTQKQKDKIFDHCDKQYPKDDRLIDGYPVYSAAQGDAWLAEYDRQESKQTAKNGGFGLVLLLIFISFFL